jgi:hypothetical protein
MGTLSKHVTLNITIVVLAGPYVTSLALECVRHHIINQAMLVPM